MASLTHVCMWSDNGWKRITAEQAARLHPGGTVSAYSGLFMCELCGQYVILTDGDIRRRYFKHSAYEKSKDCPERTFGVGYSISYGSQEHDLPIRITVSSSSFRFEVGLIRAPISSLNKDFCIEIRPKGVFDVRYVFAKERLNCDSITYLPIGENPFEKYTLSFQNGSDKLREFWPAEIKGIDPEGTLFEKSSGKKLLYDADVEIGKEYYLGLPVWELKTRQCGVLYLSLEDTDQRLQRRLVEVTGGETGGLTIATDAELLGSGLEEQLTNFLSDHPETKFVIIDTLQKIRQLKADSYSYAGDYATLTVLKQIADRFDLTILLVHHTRKQEADDAVDKISGTTGLIGCADGSLILEKENRLGTQGSLTVTSREHPDKKLLLDFDREKKIWKFLSYADSQEEDPEDPILAAVGSFLQDKSSWKGTATELLEALLRINSDLLAKPNSLVRKLNAKTRELSERYGIRYLGRREENVKYLILERVSDTSDTCDISGTPPGA